MERSALSWLYGIEFHLRFEGWSLDAEETISSIIDKYFWELTEASK